MNPISRIQKLDEKLVILRESWLDARPEKKASWMAKIDSALDSRLELMAKRDALEPLIPITIP